ncbi:MAG TPA: aminoacyl-tRNA hydrolase [Thermomicrobiales bacterium]|nr:aminoacyl-tRNA hydrolase [Thermomicrobiales bacterium]
MLQRLKQLLRPGMGPDTEDDRDMATGAHIIIGLGNPGLKYANTRHNVGFMVMEELARRSDGGGSRKRFRSQVLDARLPSGRSILVQPQTYMNESGHAVREVRNWYRADPERILIVVDDLDLPFGQLRLRQRGGAGGHNGLKSIIEQLDTQEFPRLRVGIGRGPNQAKAHVLSNFAPSEQQHLPIVIDAAAGAVEFWMREGIVTAMNEVNGRASVLPNDQLATGTSV